MSTPCGVPRRVAPGRTAAAQPDEILTGMSQQLLDTAVPGRLDALTDGFLETYVCWREEEAARLLRESTELISAELNASGASCQAPSTGGRSARARSAYSSSTTSS